MKKTLLTALGAAAVILGAIGIMMPVLPTTPFLLAAAACFSASNPKMHDWLLKTKHFGPYIENYENGGGIPKSLKYKTLAFLWIMLSISMFIVRDNVLIIVVLAVVGIGVSIHVLTIKNRTADRQPAE